jgi:NhaP-type Na+/H+ and K+/H+ antiporter
VWVAGPEENTSIAFGYAAESYVDFGVPLMFLPILIYGLLMGLAFQWWLRLIRIRELAIPLVVVMFWLALYLFERSWAKTLGGAGTLMIYLGGATYLVDRLVLWLGSTRSGLRHVATVRRGNLGYRLR